MTCPARPADFSAIVEEAGRAPIVAAMRGWLAGEPVPAKSELLRIYGSRYRSYREKWSDPDFGLAEMVRDLGSTTRLIMERQMFIREFGFALPCGEAIAALARLSPLLEVGAGSGAWARLVANVGGDIVATDSYEGTAYGFQFGKYFPVRKIAAGAAVAAYPERAVFCSWPSLGKRWLGKAALKMEPGRMLAVVREDATADDWTWEQVEAHFDPVESFYLPCFDTTHDRFEVWRRRG